MKIYTKGGDTGKTSLLGGTRVQKNDLRIESYGTVDELNSNIGLLRDSIDFEEYKKQLIDIQNILFTIGSNLALEKEPKGFTIPKIGEEEINQLEIWMDAMDETLPPLQNFVLPGGAMAVSQSHVCRVVCRRAERRCVELNSVTEIDPLLIKYLNRLSDYFFVLSRVLSKKLSAEEIPWKPNN